MKLSVALNKKIVDFFSSIPNINDANTQRALVNSAQLDPQLQNQIIFGGATAQFFQLLIPTLVQYGRLEDGRNALEAVLEAAKNFIGPDPQAYCDELLQELSGNQPASQPTRVTSSRRNRLQQKHQELSTRREKVTQQIETVSRSYYIETSPLIKMQRKEELEGLEKERNDIDQKLDEIEKELGT